MHLHNQSTPNKTPTIFEFYCCYRKYKLAYVLLLLLAIGRGYLTDGRGRSLFRAGKTGHRQPGKRCCVSAFAVLRSAACLTDSCVSLSEFFAYRRRLNPAFKSEMLVGIWIAPNLVTDIPHTLSIGDAAEDTYWIQIEESISLPPFWTVCWLKRSDAERVTRLGLLDALLDISRVTKEIGDRGPFIPVFDHSTAPLEVNKEMQDLRNCYRQHLLPPLYQHADTGELIVPNLCNA